MNSATREDDVAVSNGPLDAPLEAELARDTQDNQGSKVSLAETSVTDIDNVKPSIHIKEEGKCNCMTKEDKKNPLLESPKDRKRREMEEAGVRTLPRLSAS